MLLKLFIISFLKVLPEVPLSTLTKPISTVFFKPDNSALIFPTQTCYPHLDLPSFMPDMPPRCCPSASA
uniref:Secreted protein n=1 Tax=Panagrellus redivivus TaxID=6233 RepID=A0A7E4WCR4_PANRE